MTSKSQQLRIGYVPVSHSLENPSDRRRFVYYAKRRNLPFEIADPREKYDLVVLTQGADLSIWSQYERGGAKVVYDFIDSYLSVPRTSLKGMMRGLAKYVAGQSKYLRFNHWRALESMCVRADAVVCSTQEQAITISRFCSNVHLILDIHSMVSRASKTTYRAGEVFNLVWEGIPGNLYAFQRLKKVIAKLQARHKIALHVITDLEFRRYVGRYWKTNSIEIVRDLFDRVYMYQWNEQTCAHIICATDLAVIPIDLSNPLVRGKPENKLLLFWRLGMPTVTSATPAYERAMLKAGLNMSCRDENEWFDILEEYICDERARCTAGVAGLHVAETEYSEQAILQEWDQLFSSLQLTQM